MVYYQRIPLRRYARRFQDGGAVDGTVDPYYEPLAASAGVAPAGTPRIDQIDWGQPSWTQQALEQSQRDREAFGKEGVRGVLKDTEGTQDLAGGFSDAGFAGTIKAFHGSPHDFPEFKMEKVGTGQGAQSYGHGLYFAENPEVAEGYRRDLTNPNFNLGVGHSKYDVAGERIPSSMSGHMAMDTWSDMDSLAGMLKYRHDTGYMDTGVEQVIRQNLDRRISKFREEDKVGWHPGSAGEDMRALADFYEKKLKDARPQDITEARPGKTYEVNINADPEHFLDWDKPLSEQHPKVQEAVERVYPGAVNEEIKRSRDALAALQEKYPTSDPMGQQAAIKRNLEKMEASGGITGQKLLERLFMKSPGASQETAAQALREAGIPGIKYLDQGSRGVSTSNGRVQFLNGKYHIVDDFGTQAGPFDTKELAQQYLSTPKQTHNFVVFDDKLIDIIKKYGLAGLIAGGAAHFQMTPTDAKAEGFKRGGAAQADDATLTEEEHAQVLRAWRGLIEEKAHRGQMHYTMPPVRGMPAPGSFRIPKDVFAALGDGDLKLGGAVVHAMFGIEDDPEDPTLIHPHAVRIIGNGNINAGRRVLEKFVQRVRRQSRDYVIEQPDGHSPDTVIR